MNHHKTGDRDSGEPAPDPITPEIFESKINRLIESLRTELGNGKSRWYYDEESETLYIELENLHGIPEEIIEEKAAPVLDACDIDFEEIILLPLST
ncbi:MAG: hypothetical protein WD097_08665 [Balneolales bacterium]